MSSAVERWALAGLALMAGCSSTESPVAAASEPPAPTMLAFDLPVGVHVAVDGEAKGTTPVAPLELTAGKHRVELTTACHTMVIPELEVPGGTTSTVDAGLAPSIESATYVANARGLDGTKLAVTMSLGEVSVGAVEHGQPVRLPACSTRIELAHPGLGGFIEDLEIHAEETVVRDVVLVPGADMIRIRGGSFVMGISEAQQKRLTTDVAYAEAMYPSGSDEGGATLPPMQRTPMEIKTFDIDRHEVTAEEIVSCRAAAKHRLCDTDEECATSGGCPLPASETDFLGEYDAPYCTFRPAAGFRLETDEQSGATPANCLKPRQAEDYCRWRGKRLATDAEWEFAARSRRTDYDEPWGNEYSSLDARTGAREQQYGKQFRPEKTCSWPQGNSEQGVCDMMGSLDEYVVMSSRSAKPEERFGIKGYSKAPGGPYPQSRWPWDHIFVTRGFDHASYETGFRCARDVEQLR